MPDLAPPSRSGTVPCPACGAPFTPPVAACPACGLRLTGPDATRLWELTQTIAGLQAEADVLLDRLRAPVAGGAGVGTPLGPPPRWTPGAAGSPRRRIGGQQILLGLGALLALSAASVLILTVWIVVGFAGQAVLLLAATVAAAFGARAATRRALPAAAETGAVLATGLLGIDVLAAHARNLFGLRHIGDDVYWLCGCALMTAVLVGFDALVPRRQRDGSAARPVWLYRPAAALCATLVPWLVMAVVGPDGGVPLTLALALVTAGDAAIAWVADRLDHSRAYGGAEPWTGPVSAWVGLAGAAAALVAFYAVGIATAFDQTNRAAERYAAAGLLLLPALVIVAYAAPPAREERRALLIAAVIAVLPALGVPLSDAPWQVLWAAAIPLAAAVLWLVTGRPRPGRLPDPLLLGLLLAQPALYGAVLLLHHEDVATFGDLLVDRKARVAVPIHRFGHVPMWMLAVPALLWAVGWARLAWQGRAADRPEWALGAQVALYVTTVTALADQDPRAAVVVLLLLVAVEAVLGFAARERRLATAELVALCFAAVAASSALVAGVSAGADWAGWALIVTGVLTLVYGGAAGLVALGYLGSLIVSAGVDVLLSARDVGPVEAYSLPLAALLAAVGLWHWSRDRSLPTIVTMGPTLGVALMPTLLRAVADGDEVRLSVVTLVAIAVLLVGLLRRWKGPVTSGAVVLIVVAITQGGPLIAQLDYFVTAGVAGVLLLAVGVMWESAVVQGRRAATWYGQLR